MGINRSWNTTLSFRNLRQKTHDISRVYWTQQMSADCLQNTLLDANPSEISATIVGSSFDVRMHSQTVAETRMWLSTYMERNRLHLLVIYTAFIETYLKEIAFYFAASKNHVLNPNDKTTPLKLTKVGESTVFPIIKSSTVPDMLKYASELFEVDFGDNLTEWKKIYKIRCAAAHNGGIATPKFLQDISGMPLALNPLEYENIGLTWDELRNAMKFADEIAALIDSKVSNYEIRIWETEQVLREQYSKGTLPIRTKLWQFLHDEYSLFPIKRREKNLLIKKFY